MNNNHLLRLTISTTLAILICINAQAECKSTTEVAPTEALIETAFSPDGGSRALVLKVIQSAKKSIRLSAYSFTSTAVTQALIDARCRGVDVAVVVDYTNNITDDRNGRARAALNLLKTAEIRTRTISTYPIHHDKFIIADGQHLETGSYNYSESAAWRNSENIVVIWNNPQVAASYLAHWQNRFDQGDNYQFSDSNAPIHAHHVSPAQNN